MAAVGLADWQATILDRLHERDAVEQGQADIIQAYKRLAGHAAVLKQRNRSLLQASASATSSAATGTIGSKGGANGGGKAEDNPVRQAYISSLESQISTLRDELSSVYKTQAQNAQRLVHLTEQLHVQQDRSASEHTEVLQLRSERGVREREREEALQLRREKDRSIETLQDELGMLRLEFDMLEKRNEALADDNSALLRRWLEKKAQEAAEMDKLLEDGKTVSQKTREDRKREKAEAAAAAAAAAGGSINASAASAG